MDSHALRIAVIRHHVKIESAIVDGSKNVVRLLNSAGKQADKKALQEVRVAFKAFLSFYSAILAQIFRKERSPVHGLVSSTRLALVSWSERS